MRAPSVLIIASPYEAELLTRALGDTGLRVLRADAGEGALALLATELPITIVVGTTLLGADPVPIVAEARRRHEGVPVLLIADPNDALAEELSQRVTTIYRRPTDFEVLAHEIERIAVDAEGEELYEVEELIMLPTTPPPPPLPRVATEPTAAPEPSLIRAERTEILSEASSAVAPSPSTNGGHAPGPILLRADEALSDMAGLAMDEIAPPPPQRAARQFDDRSTIAREIDRELSQAERRLFPDHSPSERSFGDDLDDAHSDIDLDSLAIDTIPGLVQSLGIDELKPTPRGGLPVRSPREPGAQAQRPIQEEGTLDQLDVAELIARLHSNAFSGALRVALPDGDKIIYLDQGEVVGARSTLRHDDLGELLFREGKLTREQVTRAREHETHNGRGVAGEGAARPVALRLVELGLLKEGELFGAVRHHVEELVYSLFAFETGPYTVGPELPAAEDRLRLPTPMWSLVHEGVRRKYGLERLLARIGGRDVVVRPTTLSPAVVEAAGLSAEERRLVALLDGTRSLAEVRQALGPGTTESLVLGLVWTLVVCGAVERCGDGPLDDVHHASTVVSPTEPGERRARPRGTSAAQQEAEQAVERARIAVKSAQIVDADYYTVLGLAVDASEHELRRAHARLRADFEPGCFSSETATAHAEALAEIRHVLDEALRVLLSPRVREAYTATLEPSSNGDA